MKIKILSDCLRKGGEHVAAGDVIEADGDEARDLIASGRAAKEPEPEAPKEPAKEPEKSKGK